jgi:predicted DNA-binding antitoxin AbrB/MazE fold protein
MSQQIGAIYDSGVFRPLSPLSLPDKARVTLTVEKQSRPDSADGIASQKAALVKAWQDVDQIIRRRRCQSLSTTSTVNPDSWSPARDEKQFLELATTCARVTCNDHSRVCAASLPIARAARFLTCITFIYRFPSCSALQDILQIHDA